MVKRVILLLINLFLCVLLNSAKVAIVLDDFGYSGYPSRKILTIPYNLTLAILPFGPVATDFSLKAKRAGFEIILHLPLEAYKMSYIDNTYIMTAFDKDKIEKYFIRDMLKVPGISGVNNHQGSLFTENLDCMKMLLSVIKRYNLFFLDSLTTPKSKSKEVGKCLNMTILSRDIFLDNIKKEKYIYNQLLKLYKKAKKRGYAIGIGHARSITIDTINKYLPILQKRFPDVELVYLSDVYKKVSNQIK